MAWLDGTGATLWAGLDLRRRWRSLVVLGVLAGLSVALAVAAVSGARRADTAFARLTEATAGADAVVFPSQTDAAGEFDWDDLRALPYVTDVAPWNLTFGTMFEGTERENPSGLMFMPVDDHWLATTDRPVVVDGRMWDRDADSEALVDESVAAQFGVQVGDHVPLHAFAADQTTYEPDGPQLDVVVVGIVRESSQFLFTGGMIFLSPGTLVAHPEIDLIENAHVRVEHPDDVASLRRDAEGALDAPGTPILDLHSVQRRVSTAISLERIAQLLLGAAVAAAALVFVGQALARSVAQIDDDAPVLRAIGMTRSDRAVAAVVPHLLTVAIALPLALLGAWVLAARFPVGYARTVDPTVGHHIDWVVAAPALVLTAALLCFGAYALAWVHSGHVGRDSTTRTNGLAAAVRARTPAPVGLGTTMAFEPGKGRRRVPVGPALLGAAAGVLGIVGTLTIDDGLQDALHHPERAGVSWDAVVVAGPDDYAGGTDQVTAAFEGALVASEDVAAAARVGRLVLPVDGVGIAVFDVEPLVGEIGLVIRRGTAPRAPDEIALGPATAEQLGVGIGDVVELSPADGARATSPRRLRVVGTALFPHEVHSGFTEGAWVLPEVLAAYGIPTDLETGDGVEQAGIVQWGDGVDPGAALAALQEQMGPDRYVEVAELPPELVNLERVRSVPLILVAFLVTLAIAALAHVLVTSIRRRQVDFAVLRAIGFTRRMLATIVVSHSTCVGLVGLVVGIPLGVLLGRNAWSWVADQVPLVYASPFALAAVVLTVPLALVVTNAVAAYPARRIARIGTGEALRTE